MESLVLQKFKARINSIEFDDRQLYMTTEYILIIYDNRIHP